MTKEVLMRPAFLTLLLSFRFVHLLGEEIKATLKYREKGGSGLQQLILESLRSAARLLRKKKSTDTSEIGCCCTVPRSETVRPLFYEAKPHGYVLLRAAGSTSCYAGSQLRQAAFVEKEHFI